jgi:hypothetical protein
LLFAFSHCQIKSAQQAALKAARRLTTDLRITSLRVANRGQNLSYEIVRRTRNGLAHIKATDTTALVPGDLIQVTSGEDNSGI